VEIVKHQTSYVILKEYILSKKYSNEFISNPLLKIRLYRVRFMIAGKKPWLGHSLAGPSWSYNSRAGKGNRKAETHSRAAFRTNP
jgi:hypothetical protein